MKKKPVKGQVLFSLNIGNAALRCEQKLTPVTVTRVGRKYFYIEEYRREIPFDLETWAEVGDFPTHDLFEVEQEYLDIKEEAGICQKLKDAFEYGKNTLRIPLAALRTIWGIIEANKEVSGK